MKNKGFTLIELLVVVSVIGVLSGVLIPIISPQKQKQNAQDAVRRSNIEKLAQGIESHCTAEGYCPTSTEKTDANSVLNRIYVKAWPTDATYNYVPSSGTKPTDFAVYVQKATNTSHYIKFYSGWGQIRECGSANIATIDQCAAL